MAKKKMTLEEKLEEAIVKDVHYEVPERWINVNLNSIVKFEKGKKPKLLIDDFEDKAIPYVTIKCFQTKEAEQYTFATETNRLCNEDDILIVWDGARAGLIGTGVQGAVGSTLCNIRFNCINKKFMYYYFLSKYDLINSNTKGTGIPHVDPSYLETLVLSIPPLKEQQRIVDKIESLFEKLDKAKELIEEARDDFEKRKSAILEKAFRGELTKEWRTNNRNKILGKAELFNHIKEVRFSLINSNKERKEIESIFNNYKYVDETLPDGWIKLKSAMVCELISCGKTPTGSITEKGEVAYLKVYNIVNNKIDFEYKPQFIDYETHSTKLKSSMLKPNDVIMNIVGPPLKKIAIIPETYKDWNMNQALVRFRTIDCIDYKYYYYCLLYDDTLKDVINATRGVVGQANISVSQSRNLDIIVPSIEEQKEIVRILDNLLEKEYKIEELTELEEQIELIKKSILAKAFRGQLGTNCEDDESALAILKEMLKKE